MVGVLGDGEWWDGGLFMKCGLGVGDDVVGGKVVVEGPFGPKSIWIGAWDMVINEIRLGSLW